MIATTTRWIAGGDLAGRVEIRTSCLSDGLWVADEPLSGIFGTGQTLAEAVMDLRAALVDFRDALREVRDSLAPQLRRTLTLLESLLNDARA